MEPTTIALQSNLDFSGVLNPVDGPCGIGFWTRYIEDFLYTDVITFTLSSSTHSNSVEIKDDPNNTYVGIGTAIVNTKQFTSAGFTYSASGVGTYNNYPNTIIISQTGGSGDASFEVGYKGPFYTEVISESPFTLQISLLENPIVGDYLIINPPKKELHVRLDHVLQINGEEELSSQQFITPHFKIDRDDNSVDANGNIDATEVLKLKLRTPLPTFYDPSNGFSKYYFYYQDDMIREYVTYYALVKDGQPFRTNQYRGGVVIEYKTDPYLLYTGKCAGPDGKTIDYAEYSAIQTSNVKFLSYSSLFNRPVCRNHRFLLYIHLPDPVTTDLEINWYSDNVSGSSDVNPQNNIVSGVYQVDISDWFSSSNSSLNQEDSITISVAEANVGVNSWSSSAASFTFKDPKCEECCFGVEFLYLSSFGVFEHMVLLPANKEKIEGKAVDITRTFPSQPNSSRFLANHYQNHRNRGIISEKTEDFKTPKIENTEENVNTLRDFFTSTEVYLLEDNNDLTPVAVKPANFIVENSKHHIELDVTVEYLENKQYTNNLT